MDTTLFPTKGNLILAKNTLRLSMQGYELLDKKRNVLIREMMDLIEKAKQVQQQIDTTFSEAYLALQAANIMLGISNVEQIGYAIPLQSGVEIHFRSVMGVEIPMVADTSTEKNYPYGFFRTSSALDLAYKKFERVKLLTLELAEIENTVYRLATNIKKTQKRANALKNIVIPRYQQITSDIQNSLEEKEREEFGRLKVIKSSKSKKKDATFA